MLMVSYHLTFILTPKSEFTLAREKPPCFFIQIDKNNLLDNLNKACLVLFQIYLILYWNPEDEISTELKVLKWTQEMSSPLSLCHFLV